MCGAVDLTHISMAKGFCYLEAIMDWASRMILSWRFSNTLDISFHVDALREAITKYGTPEIFNTDQGSQFTSNAFIDVLSSNNISINMDGKNRLMDNVFIERLWKSVKYEDIYLHQYLTAPEARRGLDKYFMFYNTERIHESLGYKTPYEIYFKEPLKQAA